MKSMTLLPLDEWKPTRDTLHSFARIFGKIRQALTPRQKHWGHISLFTEGTGLTTTPIPAGGPYLDQAFALQIDLCSHHWALQKCTGEKWLRPMTGWSPSSLGASVLEILAGRGIRPSVDFSELQDQRPMEYDPLAAQQFWNNFYKIYLWFQQFRGELREECTAVQLWPHHFDLSFSWFSGRKVPGQDPKDEEKSDEQMTFGFSTGDQGIPAAYFYATAYPEPRGWMETTLPGDGFWQKEGWNGAALLFENLGEVPDPQETLLSFLRSAQQAGRQAMK